MKAEGGRRKAERAVVGGRWSVVREGGGRKAEGGMSVTIHYPLSTIHCLLTLPSPLSSLPCGFRLPPSALRPPPCRSGVSLLEVLVSIGVLSIGLLTVAMLIPVGKISLMETEKSDRTGACGRAALREVEVRRMLDYKNNWWWPTGTHIVQDADTPGFIAIDPLGRLANISDFLDGALNNIPRCSLWYAGSMMPTAVAEPIFYWQDELLFDLPKERTSVPPTAGDRPWATTASGNLPSPGDPQLQDANFSWFFTVTPSPADVAGGVQVQYRHSYKVAIVVCYKRVLSSDGERLIPDATNTLTCISPGFGGTTITYGADIISGNPPLKNNEWILLYSMNGTTIVQADWYRVVHAGYDATNNTSHITLVGPDWYGGTGIEPSPDTKIIRAVLVGGVTGVYTTTIQLDNDLIWTR